MTTKCSHGHDKVCANIMQLKKIKMDTIFLGIFFINFNCFQLHYVWVFAGHWMQKHLILSFCYTPMKLTFSPTPPSQKALPRSPARLWQWQQVKTLSQMTREHTGTIKLKSPGGCNENAQFWFGPTDYCITPIFRVEEIFAIFANWDFARNIPPAKIISTANGISRNFPPAKFSSPRK